MKKKSSGKIFIVVIVIAMVLVIFMTWMRSQNVTSKEAKSNVKETTSSETIVPTFTPVTKDNMIGEAIVTFKEDPVTIKVGEKYDAKDNILSVTDKEGNELTQVVGDMDYSNPDLPALPHVDDMHYYIINEFVDTSKAGTQNVSVFAIDKNSQISLADFKVNIVE